MNLLLDLLKSGTFWTAFGSIATAIGVFWVIYKETMGWRGWSKDRKEQQTKQGNEGGIDKPTKNGEGRTGTNREKILACLKNHRHGATLGQIAEESGIPIGSLSSDMAGREAMGIEKEGYGQTAIYRLRREPKTIANESALRTLHSTLAGIRSNPHDPKNQEIAGIIAARDEVIARYGPIFSPENIHKLDSETFLGFLLFRNNHHWGHMQRQGGWMTADMPRLRETLALLVNESLPLKVRLDRLRPTSGQPMIKGLSRAVITPILLVVYPDKYGVWNSTSRVGMARLGLWPKLPGNASFSESYEAINRVLLDVAARMGIDLWTLDALWWRIARGVEPSSDEEADDPPIRTVQADVDSPAL